ncbi:hypothetical protein MHU86_20333 [Fragilaria crotonensis]|nr:hypothetical protein MHU86_20333 [Fragilaria crotonensis]
MNILLLLLLLVVLLLSNAAVASAMICPYATRRITSYFAFTVDLLYGKNTTCSDDEQVTLRDFINDAMTSMNLTKAGGPSREITGDICTDANSTNDGWNRNLVRINSYTWVGRAVCQLCTPARKLRRLSGQSVAAEDAADLASIELTNLISNTYGDDPDSCLHDDWTTVVVVSVTEMTQTPEDPCE